MRTRVVVRPALRESSPSELKRLAESLFSPGSQRLGMVHNNSALPATDHRELTNLGYALSLAIHTGETT